MQYYLAIDIGASSGRHILAHMEDGRLMTEEIYRFPNAPVSDPATGALKWDVDRLFSEILAGLAVAAQLGKIPATVGIDTWGVDYVLLDGNDRPIDGAFAYRDARTLPRIDALHGIVPYSDLYARTGIQFNSFNTVYQLFDDRMTGRLSGARTFLMLPDYFNFRLTGKKKQEYTNATTTGLVNAVTHTWDEAILQKLGYPSHLFGTLSQPGTVVGELLPEIERAVGYKTTVMLPATHDTASAVIAAPLEGDTPYISSGTWSLLGVEQPYAHTDAACRDEYSNEGSVNGRFRLQKNIMGLWMIQQVRHELNDAYDFATLADMARTSPVEDVLNVNDARFLAPESMIDEINRAVGRTLTVGEMAYCIYHSLAVSYAQSLDVLEKLTGEKYETLNIIGGGSKNTLLNEMTAQTTRRRIITGPAEGTAIGNLCMQMIGNVTLSSVADARALVRRSFDIVEL